MQTTKREIIVKSFSKETLGIQSEDEVWYNLEKELSADLKLKVRGILAKLNKGDTVELLADFQQRIYIAFSITKKAEKKSVSNVVKIKEKDHVTYKRLLDQAHSKGLRSIEILESWVNEDMSREWCKVRAKFKVGDDEKEMFFDGFGSATPENTTDMTKTHPVEMSNTRAKGRALRDFLNIGEAMIEELKGK